MLYELARRRAVGYQNECFMFPVAASCGELNPADLALQVIRVIRARPACPVAPGDGTGVGSENRTGVICEICGLKRR